MADMLGLGVLLDRKPAALSGGQRQRVAMGRALVREPRTFLMDEPLSNLDAKPRTSMRGELARLHELLPTTTVYVTHDQVEAMTMGQRIAVMNTGLLMQVLTGVVWGSNPRATPLRLRSVSVMMPMYRRSSSTRSDPTFHLDNMRPASFSGASRCTLRTSADI